MCSKRVNFQFDESEIKKETIENFASENLKKQATTCVPVSSELKWREKNSTEILLTYSKKK